MCKQEKREQCGEPYMGYEKGTCESEMFYDEASGECVLRVDCPTDPNEKNPCDSNGKTFPVPGSCSQYKGIFFSFTFVRGTIVSQRAKLIFEEGQTNTNAHTIYVLELFIIFGQR